MSKIIEDMKNEAFNEGYRLGIEEGRKIVIKEKARNTAKRMWKTGKYKLEEIVNISGLSLDEVKALEYEQQ